MKPIALLIFPFVLMACSQDTSPASASATQPDFRQVFIQSCIESASSSGSPLPADKITELCSCTHDRTAASYGSPEQWQQAMRDYDQKRSNPADLEQRLRQTADQCKTQIQAASSPTSSHDSGTTP